MEVGSWLQTLLHQVVGMGDSVVQAPNRQPIQPKVEPLSEDIKYFLFDFFLSEADLHILEGDSMLRLQVYCACTCTCTCIVAVVHVYMYMYVTV